MTCPPAIQAEIEHVAEQVGMRPDADRIGQRRWRLCIATDRVRMTVDYKVTANGRAVWAGSTLDVDGQPRPLANDAEDLRSIIANPDARTTLDELPPSADIRRAPPGVQHYAAALLGKLGNRSDFAQVGSDSRRWVIGVQSADRSSGLQVIFKRRRKGAGWWMRLRVVIDGIDRSREVDDDTSKALELLADTEFFRGSPKSSPATAGAGTAIRPGGTDPRRFGSVEQRRSAVIRN